jgi:outer membrane protein assembly factor BamB
MKKIATSWIVSVAIVLLAGCSPNGDDLPAPGSSDDIIYYDYHGDSITYPQTGNYVQSGRVAVNASTGNVIWEKTNPNAILNNYLGYSSILTYARSFEQGDFIIKIYPSSPIPSNDHNSTKVDGVYFHKINRNTGQEIVFKKIIQANEITASNKFAMSRVETDGTNFYFSLNANAIYCINANGDLVWKKDGYPAANVDYLGYYFGYSLVYYDQRSACA